VIIIGIDPGKTGAAVGINDKMHTMVIRARCYYAGSDLVPSSLAASLREIRRDLGGGDVFVVTEVQQSMPKQGLSSTFRTGLNYGRILGTVEGIGWRLETLRATAWRKLARITVGRGSDPKQATIAEMSRRLPDLALIPKGCRVPQDGIADAAGMCLAGLVLERGRGAPE